MVFINVLKLVDKLNNQNNLTEHEYEYIFANATEKDLEYISGIALEQKKKFYNNEIFLRGIVEFTNYCKNDCLYCGIRAKNKEVSRYRLSKQEIMSCCDEGYSLGIRTFVLQGGEDRFFTTDMLCEIVRDIKKSYGDVAVTLSVGEQSEQDYIKLKKAGADRYLLREETADDEHYNKLHPENMTLEHRKNCLYSIKKAGFQTGGGFMVGSPYQTDLHLAKDMVFLRELGPQMVGIGPFIPHESSVFKDFKSGTLHKTLLAVALTRLTLKKAMIPSTTALETIEIKGRIKGFLSGANVIMVNLTPQNAKKNYLLYNDKAFVDKDAKDCIYDIKTELLKHDMFLSVSVGNPVQWETVQKTKS